METKLIAAELATAAGCATVITLGSMPTRILTIVQNHAARTVPSSPMLGSSASLPQQDSSTTSREPREPSPSALPGVEFAATPASQTTIDESHPPYTLFTPKVAPLTSRRFWILHGLTPRGTVFVDEGAYRALTRGERDGGGSGNGGRLLAAGVLRVEGAFAAGQAVRVCVLRKKGTTTRRGQGAERSRGRMDARSVLSSTPGTPGTPGTPNQDDRPHMLSRASSPDHFADRRRSVNGSSAGGSSEQLLVEDIEAMRIGDGSPAPPDSMEPANEEDEIIEFGRGLSNYNSVEIDRVKGHRR